MPQLQNLVLTDRATPTPIDHTFIPRDIVANVGTVVETSGVPIGDNRVTINLARTSNGRYKARAQFTFPVVETATINGIDTPTVVRTAYAELHLTVDQTSSESERNNIMGMLEDACKGSSTLVNDVFVKLQGVY